MQETTIVNAPRFDPGACSSSPDCQLTLIGRTCANHGPGPVPFGMCLAYHCADCNHECVSPVAGQSVRVRFKIILVPVVRTTTTEMKTD